MRATAERRDGADLHEGRQVVARRQEEPYRQHRRGEAVGDDQEGQHRAVKVEKDPQRGLCVHIAPADHGQRQEDHPDGRTFQDPSGTKRAQVDPYQQRDGDGRRHRARRPRAVLHGVDHHETEHRDQDHHDRHDPDEGHGATDRPELVARHLTERAAVAAGGKEQHHEVLDTTAHHPADEDPQGPREIPELRGQGGSDERPRTRDGGEVVAEYDPLVGRDEVATVVQPFRRGGAGRVQAQHPDGDEGAVETISEGIDANRRGDEPEARYRFPAVQGDAPGGRRAEHRDAKPCEPREQAARGSRRRLRVGS